VVCVSVCECVCVCVRARARVRVHVRGFIFFLEGLGGDEMVMDIGTSVCMLVSLSAYLND
jgi:hypothetical protein